MAEEKSGWSMDFTGFSHSDETSDAGATAGSGRQPGVKIQSRRATSGTVDSSVGARSRMEGRFEFLGGAELSGEVSGEISAAGDLIIGESASIRATIRGERIKIFGQVEGDLFCTERLEAFAGAKIAGDVHCPRVVMHDGVVFDGQCFMGTSLDDDAASAPKKKANS